MTYVKKTVWKKRKQGASVCCAEGNFVKIVRERNKKQNKTATGSVCVSCACGEYMFVRLVFPPQLINTFRLVLMFRGEIKFTVSDSAQALCTQSQKNQPVTSPVSVSHAHFYS